MAATSTNKSKRKMSDDDSDGLSKKKPTQYWNQGLLSSIDDPELKVDADDKVVIIRDKYPKAKFHFLVMPKVNIPNLKSLKSEHLALLKHMETRGKEIAQRCHVCSKDLPNMPNLKQHIKSHDYSYKK
ncbi:hypothetical protein ACJMK2_013772 [Sinanodonta woodiana]|uniref:C2H2-type domain-containing protein n=1 Tax=Sinanodonta woodiana TaxID=1069815 RepID=A0ABD3UYJ0_SINWO